MASEFTTEAEQSALCDKANQWLARFAPLVASNELPFESDTIRYQLSTVDALKQDAPDLQAQLQQLDGDSGRDLLATIQQATGQLGSIETDLRQQLAKIAPGDPQGIVDIASLQDRLAERQAKQEIGVTDSNLVPGTLDVETSPPNVGAALGMGLFGFAWTSFTLVHCILMVGGFAKAFGAAAFGLLAFYSIFFFAGFAMLASAFNSICTESIRLNGRKLTVLRKFGSWTRSKSFDLSPTTVASVGDIQADAGFQSSSNSAQSGRKVQSINMTDVRGKAISFASGTSLEYKGSVAKKINEYLAARG